MAERVSASAWQTDRLDATLEGMASGLQDTPEGLAVFFGATRFSGLEDTSQAKCYAAEQNLGWTPLQDSGDALSLYRTPSGGSPAHHAVRFGFNQLRSIDATSSDRHLVLITDGPGNYGFGAAEEMGTNCIGDGINRVDPRPLWDEVQSAHDNEGIFSWAIGLPGSLALFRDVLSGVSRAGGTPQQECINDPQRDCHINFDVNFGSSWDFREDLSFVMSEMAELMASCAFEIPDRVGNVNALDVTLETSNSVASLNPSAGCADRAGFAIADDRYVFLCPDACEIARTQKVNIVAIPACP